MCLYHFDSHGMMDKVMCIITYVLPYKLLCGKQKQSCGKQKQSSKHAKYLLCKLMNKLYSLTFVPFKDTVPVQQFISMILHFSYHLTILIDVKM